MNHKLTPGDLDMLLAQFDAMMGLYELTVEAPVGDSFFYSPYPNATCGHLVAAVHDIFQHLVWGKPPSIPVAHKSVLRELLGRGAADFEGDTDVFSKGDVYSAWRLHCAVHPTSREQKPPQTRQGWVAVFQQTQAALEARIRWVDTRIQDVSPDEYQRMLDYLRSIMFGVSATGGRVVEVFSRPGGTGYENFIRVNHLGDQMVFKKLSDEPAQIEELQKECDMGALSWVHLRELSEKIPNGI